MKMIKTKLSVFLMLLCAALFFVQCKNENKNSENSIEKGSSTNGQDSSAVQEKKEEIQRKKLDVKYTALIIPDKKKDSIMAASKSSTAKRKDIRFLL